MMARISVGLFLIVAVSVGVGFFMSTDSSISPAGEPIMPTDPILAKAQKDAARGDARAQYYVGWQHWQRGEYSQALPFLKTAAAKNTPEASYLLALAHLKGKGTVQDFRAAQTHFTQAADGGHLEAQYELGILYRDGLASLPDKEKAYIWLNVAAARGHEDALLYRDKLTAAMTTEELVRAQADSVALHQTFMKTSTASAR
jgi:TPR repeat protein